MKIPPNYTVTGEMLSLISKIQAQQLYFSSLTIPQVAKEKIQRVSLLKSSLFSARIEGNPLELADFDFKKTDEDKKREVFNILSAVDFIDNTLTRGDITKDFLLQLHGKVLKNIHPDGGEFRSVVSAIFNQAGVAVYIPPPPSDLPRLLETLFTYINTDTEKFPLIASFIAHLVFEKIHPFLDGNGRVGRLLIAAVLKVKGWDISFSVPFEEYLDMHKDEYYFHLDKGLQQTNDYLLFMLTAFLQQTEKVKVHIEDELAKKEPPFLPPRQEEIYNIIKDHTVVSFDMIRRRFLSVPQRTLRYDLKKLVDGGLVEKAGETKGRYYRIKKL